MKAAADVNDHNILGCRWIFIWRNRLGPVLTDGTHSLMDSLMDSLTHELTHSDKTLTHSLMHILTHSLMHTLTHSDSHSLTVFQENLRASVAPQVLSIDTSDIGNKTLSRAATK